MGRFFLCSPVNSPFAHLLRKHSGLQSPTLHSGRNVSLLFSPPVGASASSVFVSSTVASSLFASFDARGIGSASKTPSFTRGDAHGPRGAVLGDVSLRWEPHVWSERPQRRRRSPTRSHTRQTSCACPHPSSRGSRVEQVLRGRQHFTAWLCPLPARTRTLLSRASHDRPGQIHSVLKALHETFIVAL